MKKQMTYTDKEAKIPSSLKLTQKWFAGIMTNKLNEYNQIQTIAPSGLVIAEEATRYIVPSPTLQPHQRMQIYNQQYWWRLLNTLHENFPLVTRLFGYHAFNEEIGIPYLLKYPPNHWSLNLLGERLPKWILNYYQALDRPLIYNAANLDCAYIASFNAPQKSSLDLSFLQQGGNPESFLNYTFFLQPHIHLFKWDYDLFTFRQSFLEHDVDYWLDNNFPPLGKGKTYYCLLYRLQTNKIMWKEITLGEYVLLGFIQRGASIEQACEFLEKQDTSIYEQATENLQKWFQDWTIRGWLTLESYTHYT
jgi:hypothetical protein